jgi:hypothetical protein
MFFLWGLIVGIIAGIPIGFMISGLFRSEKNDAVYSLEELNRLQERTRDYYNNPVVEYMKRTNYKP